MDQERHWEYLRKFYNNRWGQPGVYLRMVRMNAGRSKRSSDI
jgi:hypothetical protein